MGRSLLTDEFAMARARIVNDDRGMFRAAWQASGGRAGGRSLCFS